MKKIFERLYTKSFTSFCELLKNKIDNKEKTFIITANPETFMLSEQDSEMQKMLNDKNVTIVPDGIGVVKAAKMININVKERIAGVDIAKFLLEYANEKKLKVYLFGSKEEVIEGMKNVIKKDYSSIKLVGATNGYVTDKDNEFKNIKKANPDIVMVALGIPAQEKLIYKHLDEFKKGVFIGVGGSFDVLSGTKKRAPKIFIKLNLEWLYRIMCEPKRLKRFWNSNVKFLFKVKKYK